MICSRRRRRQLVKGRRVVDVFGLSRDTLYLDTERELELLVSFYLIIIRTCFVRIYKIMKMAYSHVWLDVCKTNLFCFFSIKFIL